MPHAALKPWTEAEFFAWHERQERRHELVDGQPRAMTGANNRHKLVALNLFRALHRRLQGQRCRPLLPADSAVRIPGGNVRYPDVVVDCGPFRPDDHAAAEPILAVEILSPSTRSFDQTRKLEEYRSVPAIRHILLLDPEAPRAQLYTRAADGAWRWQVFENAEADLPMTAVAITLPLAECYGVPPD